MSGRVRCSHCPKPLRPPGEHGSHADAGDPVQVVHLVVDECDSCEGDAEDGRYRAEMVGLLGPRLLVEDHLIRDQLAGAVVGEKQGHRPAVLGRGDGEACRVAAPV